MVSSINISVQSMILHISKLSRHMINSRDGQVINRLYERWRMRVHVVKREIHLKAAAAKHRLSRPLVSVIDSATLSRSLRGLPKWCMVNLRGCHSQKIDLEEYSTFLR